MQITKCPHKYPILSVFSDLNQQGCLLKKFKLGILLKVRKKDCLPRQDFHFELFGASKIVFKPL